MLSFKFYYMPKAFGFRNSCSSVFNDRCFFFFCVINVLIRFFMLPYKFLKWTKLEQHEIRKEKLFCPWKSLAYIFDLFIKIKIYFIILPFFFPLSFPNVIVSVRFHLIYWFISFIQKLFKTFFFHLGRDIIICGLLF